MTTQPAVVATKTNTTFRQECAVTATIAADPPRIWQLLTNLGDTTRWNTTLTSIEGNAELGGTVKMKVPEAPDQVFAVKVTSYTQDREMVWTKGNLAMLRGVRTYRLTPNSDGTTTFWMSEVFSGLMLPMIVSQLPDFQAMFQRYGADLKTEAEKP